MKAAQMKMLRKICGVAGTDRISNEYVKGNLDVTNIATKMRENRLTWFGHVERA